MTCDTSCYPCETVAHCKASGCTPTQESSLPRKRFVMQTELGEEGNCFSACLASLFGISLATVPNFFKTGGRDATNWWLSVKSWLSDRGYGVISIDPSAIADMPGMLIVSGPTARENGEHAVLWKDGKMLWDPHPDQVGIKHITAVDLIYPLDPSIFKDARCD